MKSSSKDSTKSVRSRFSDRTHPEEIILRIPMIKPIFLVTAFVFCFISAKTVFADGPAYPNVQKFPAVLSEKRDLSVSEQPGRDSSVTENRRDYAIPALEIAGFEFLLNQVHRNFVSSEYKSNFSTIKNNIQGGWYVDYDPFLTNQMGHPYQGSVFHGFARSSGMNYWKSFVYDFAGSALWEIVGETTPSSKNDLFTTTFGGSFLGEALFRISNLALKYSGLPEPWRELGAAAVSPAAGFNRLVFKDQDRFDMNEKNLEPVCYNRFQTGFIATGKDDSGISMTKFKPREAFADYALDYGLPGKRGYTYNRPFDYFSFHAALSGANGLENLMTHGLLVGKTYHAGPDYRGIYGLYGNYDYTAPHLLNVSSVALSIGTTAQWWLSNAVAFQGTALAGAGCAAAGSIHSTSDTDYRYGFAPQALLALRLIFGKRASLDLTAREFLLNHVTNSGGHDNVTCIDASLTVRIHRRHAVSVKYLGNYRNVFHAESGDISQSTGTIGVFYTFLGEDRFGAFDWRQHDPAEMR